VQTIQVVDEHPVDLPLAQVVEHPRVPRPHPAVEGAHVVVDVPLHDLPALQHRELLPGPVERRL
jgi:hypothetical protein